MRYEFKMPPADPKSLPAYLSEEFSRVQQAFVQPAEMILLKSVNVAPSKARDGMVLLASGAWNPGSGPGYYGYRAGAWRFLG
ncbi:MAG: hypothetical protein RL758_272 [Pseudomonadota bacterium]|jgi:hypothetical protein